MIMRRVCGRGTYEVVQTYDQGTAGKHPFAWDAGGQYMAWLGLQAAGGRPASVQTHCHVELRAWGWTSKVLCTCCAVLPQQLSRLSSLTRQRVITQDLS